MRFKLAYDTLAMESYAKSLKETINEIKRWLINPSSSASYRGNDIIAIVKSEVISNVPTFNHPITLEKSEVETYMKDSMSHGTHISFFDARELMSVVNYNDKVKNKMEFNFQYLRTAIQNYAFCAGGKSLLDISTLPISIFASWISENIGRRYNLQPGEQYFLSIYSAIYYVSLFEEKDRFSEEDVQRFTAIISQAVNAKAEDVFSVFDTIDNENIELINITKFCAGMHIASTSIRLKDIRPAVLYTILQSTWFGYNYRENIPVALEHPPTWMTLIAAAVSERGYSKSGIAAITERRSYNEKRENYIRSLFNLIGFEKIQ